MANAEKGEVSIQIGDTTYTLALTLDAMVTLEEMLSTPDRAVFFTEIAVLSERGSIKHTRALIWALFQAHHPNVTLADVSGLVQKAGGIVEFGKTLEAVIQRSKPDPRDVADLGVKPNPPRAQAGAGKRSNGTGASSTSAPGAPA
jgi:hypothetical protein